MKAVIQRVSEASVSVDGEIVGSCKSGLMILFCACDGDTKEDTSLLASKTAALRIFNDENGKMNRSVLDVDGEALVISQFTLSADTRKGNRPSFTAALEPQAASSEFERFCVLLSQEGVRRVEKGVFGADMKVSLVNDGPVTIILDTRIWRKNEN